MNETPTTIAHVKDESGMVVGRIRIMPDYDSGHDMSLDELLGGRGVTIAPVWVGERVDIDFYQVGHDSKFLSVLERFGDEYNRNRDELVEIFTRYMRIFHPLVPVVDQWIQTGYSQGDCVQVLAWAEKTAIDIGTSKPGYKWAAEEHDMIVDTDLKIVGAHARGQYITTVYETMSVDQVIIEDEENIALTVTWDEQDSIGGTMYLEEFAPNATAIETAKRDLGVPEGATIEEV